MEPKIGRFTFTLPERRFASGITVVETDDRVKFVSLALLLAARKRNVCLTAISRISPVPRITLCGELLRQYVCCFPNHIL